jgi:hypothetical protein
MSRCAHPTMMMCNLVLLMLRTMAGDATMTISVLSPPCAMFARRQADENVKMMVPGRGCPVNMYTPHWREGFSRDAAYGRTQCGDLLASAPRGGCFSLGLLSKQSVLSTIVDNVNLRLYDKAGGSRSME